MRALTVNSMGHVEIGDDVPDSHGSSRALVWKGPYQPGGKDAVDVVDPSWPALDYARAKARWNAFSDADKKKARSNLPAGYSSSGGGKTKTQITKPEYAALTYVTAQALTGSKTATPTAKQVAEAQKQAQAAILKAGVGVKGGTVKVDKLFNKARSELSGISGMGAEECAGIWDVIKSAIIKSAPVMPFLGPATGLVAPTAAVLIAKNAKKAKPAPKPAAAEPAAAADDTDPSNTQVVGGEGEDVLVYGEPIAEAYRGAEDALIFGEGGGASELGAAKRMQGRKTPYYFPPTVTGEDTSTISPTAYRLAVIQRASRLAGQGKPIKTKHMFFAQKSVDRDLSSGGINVQVPGGRPGRVTR